MRLSWEVGVRSFRRATTYRLATFSGVFVNTVFGYLRASVLVFVATSNGGDVQGMSDAELATFAFVSQGFLMIAGAFGDPELAERIRNGDIVVDLYRPADVQAWWLATWYGKSAFQVLARGVPPVVLGALTFDLRWPDPWWHWLVFGISIVLATTVGFAIRFCSNLFTFWLLDNRGVDLMVTLLVSFFGGLLLPVNLFPSWLQTVADLLPFIALIQLPVEIYLGFHDGTSLITVLAQQLMWVVLLLSLGRLMLVAATRRVVIQGG
ncbi:MAG: ABC transporter permease [Actinomycetia bacterium]|nr:ABC transporter permease [Actinomycetes bacterium]MCP4222904.1 ABC transporter permease [Actinomycetes bacterium]MCP5033282.1 ABC transporter permease [Actinomycetes bacterium]